MAPEASRRDQVRLSEVVPGLSLPARWRRLAGVVAAAVASASPLAPGGSVPLGMPAPAAAAAVCRVPFSCAILNIRDTPCDG